MVSAGEKRWRGQGVSERAKDAKDAKNASDLPGILEFGILATELDPDVIMCTVYYR